MRRVYATILLIPVLILFTGSVTLASSCAKIAAAECGAMAKAPENCIMAVSHQDCEGRAVSHQGCGARVDRCGQTCHKGCHKGQTGKDEQRGKDGSNCCVECPLCTLVTFKPFFRWDVTRQVTMIDYTVMSDNNLSDYFHEHWKPPNGAFLS